MFDFGQLNTSTERDYIYQLVSDHVSIIRTKEGYSIYARTLLFVLLSPPVKMKNHSELSQQRPAVIQAVAKVLAWSQKYMRDRKARGMEWGLKRQGRQIIFCLFHRMSAAL